MFFIFLFLDVWEARSRNNVSVFLILIVKFIFSAVDTVSSQTYIVHPDTAKRANRSLYTL